METPEQMLSFDQYQRYRMVADMITGMSDSSTLRILDIGSGRCNLADMIPGAYVIKLDKGGMDEPNLIQGDATDIPFKDGYFDFVVSCDCFEHIPEADRESFISESVRVSRGKVVIACPFDGNGVAEAESVVNSFHEFIYGYPNYNLVEHAEAGLPSLPALLSTVGSLGFRADCYDNGYLEHWLPMMILNFYLEKNEYWEVTRIINTLYNRSFYRSDNNPSAYRKVVVISSVDDRFDLAAELTEPTTGLQHVSASLFAAVEGSMAEDMELLGKTEGAEEGDISDAVKNLISKERALDGFRKEIGEFVTNTMDAGDPMAGILLRFAAPFHNIPSPLSDFASNEAGRDKKKASRILSECLKYRPDNGEAWNDLGVISLSENDLEAAEKALTNACLLSYPLAYRNLAMLYLIAGDPQMAKGLSVEAIRKGIEPQFFSDLDLFGQ